MWQLFTIQLAPGIAFEACADTGLELRPGARVLVQCERYQDLGTVRAPASEPFSSMDDIRHVQENQARGRHVAGHVVPEIQRLALPVDLRRAANNEKTAAAMHRKTVERIKARKLGMRLIHSHLTLDNRMLLCQFTAAGRVDFRQLLQDLSNLFRTRVELRQVGVRDEAAILGGVGVCGRPLCCATFLRNIANVNVRMAKQQGLVLTPQSISGACGRLKCCLHFEHNGSGEAATGEGGGCPRHCGHRAAPENPPPHEGRRRAGRPTRQDGPEEGAPGHSGKGGKGTNDAAAVAVAAAAAPKLVIPLKAEGIVPLGRPKNKEHRRPVPPEPSPGTPE